MYKNLLKPIIDFIVALSALTALAPLIVLLAILLALYNKGNPFFIQQRPGRHDKVFKLFKFKTMNDRLDDSGNLLPDEQRMTALGKVMRKTSLDELPQLFNVLKGEMSLIGPRPLLVEYLSLYNDEQRKRHRVKPGITGWAQVHGRNTISWHEKFKLDVWYVENLSISLDMLILLKTIQKVLIAEGVSSSTTITMEKFKGN